MVVVVWWLLFGKKWNWRRLLSLQLISTNCINKGMKEPGWRQHFLFNLFISIKLYIFREGRREWHKETQIQFYTDHQINLFWVVCQIVSITNAHWVLTVYSSNHFTCFISFHPHNNPMRQLSLLSLLSPLTKISWVVSVGARVWTQNSPYCNTELFHLG